MLLEIASTKGSQSNRRRDLNWDRNFREIFYRGQASSRRRLRRSFPTVLDTVAQNLSREVEALLATALLPSPSRIQPRQRPPCFEPVLLPCRDGRGQRSSRLHPSLR